MSWFSDVESDVESCVLELWSGLRVHSPTSQGLRANSLPGSRAAPANPSSSTGSSHTQVGPNAILFQYQPTGKIPGGVQASQAQAAVDAARIINLKTIFNTVAIKYNVPPALLAGIASRESRVGASLSKDGWGDYNTEDGTYHAYGIMQIDRYEHPNVNTEVAPDSLAHVEEATQLLAQDLQTVETNVNDKGWPTARQLQRAVAIYNGDNSHQAHTLVPDTVDLGTTGGDYSNDVWARAQYFAGQW